MVHTTGGELFGSCPPISPGRLGLAGPANATGMLLKTGGIFFLLSGWWIVLGAVALLRAPAGIGIFLAAGLAVEIAGLGMLVRAHMARRPRSR